MVTLALAGAGLGFISNVSRGENDAHVVLRARDARSRRSSSRPSPSSSRQAGSASGSRTALLLGFGLLTLAGAIGIWQTLGRRRRRRRDARCAAGLAGAGVLVLIAGLIGTAGAVSSPEAWGAPFRWGPASLLAVVAAMVAVAALFVSFGTWPASGNPTKLFELGKQDGFTGIALEPIVAIAVACVAAYALGKEGAVRLLAAGMALALAAQTALFYGSLLGAVVGDYRGFWKDDADMSQLGFLVGFTAAGLMLAAGLVGRRSS